MGQQDCQKCGKAGGKVVGFDMGGIKMARWVCPHCMGDFPDQPPQAAHSPDQTTPTVGRLLSPNAHRDAIHMAVAPVIAAERLEPGMHIGFVSGSTEKVTSGARLPLGIVDPFLLGDVSPGDRFWMFLYPGTITTLRHAWQHPAFKAKVPEVSGD